MQPPGVLRVLTLFHETHVLGASTSVLRVTDELAWYGWTMSGWLPGTGTLHELASRRLALVLQADSPVAYSVSGWRARPGLVSRARRSPGYLRAVRAAIECIRPHVVHANTLLSLPEAAVARSCGLPIVLQSHEVPPPSVKSTLAIRCAAQIADVLVGVSDAATAVLRRHAGRTPVLTVRNGVPEFEAASRSSTGPFVVGTVATISRTKGTDVFLRAARLALEQRPDIRFEHVGATNLHRDHGLDAELARLEAEIRPAGAISMRGSIPAGDVLPEWDVFLSTSRSDAFPLATLEAMASGLPVVAPTVGGIPEQIEHLESGILVRPDDPEAIATWLVRLHDEPELRARLGAAAAHRARTEFTLARQADGLHRAYLTALNLRFAPPGVRSASEAPA
jgi:glycosyltransferase involved in cell wall biosynthesis